MKQGEEKASVPDFGDLLVNPDLSKEALKGLIMEYEKKRLKYEEDLELIKKENKLLIKEIDEMKPKAGQSPKSEGSSDAGSNSGKESEQVKGLKAQLLSMVQEKATLLKMWKAAEQAGREAKEELASSNRCTKLELMAREIGNLQRDYSDAINLLEGKLHDKEIELNYTQIDNEKLKKEVSVLQSHLEKAQKEIRSLEDKSHKIERDKEELSSALDRCLQRVEEAVEIETQAREKVKEAIEMTEHAISRQNTSVEEKEKLEKELDELKNQITIKYKMELEELNKNLATVKKKLNVSFQEKEDILSNHEKIKVECLKKLQEVINKNKSLSLQLKDLQERKHLEKTQWNEERKMLRLQIMTLQSSMEQVNTNLREQKILFPCKKCSELKKKCDKYKRIATRWRKSAHELKEKIGKADS